MYQLPAGGVARWSFCIDQKYFSPTDSFLRSSGVSAGHWISANTRTALWQLQFILHKKENPIPHRTKIPFHMRFPFLRERPAAKKRKLCLKILLRTFLAYLIPGLYGPEIPSQHRFLKPSLSLLHFSSSEQLLEKNRFFFVKIGYLSSEIQIISP
jgi:hypothetical protein